jgi:hypothetical protein
MLLFSILRLEWMFDQIVGGCEIDDKSMQAFTNRPPHRWVPEVARRSCRWGDVQVCVRASVFVKITIVVVNVIEVDVTEANAKVIEVCFIQGNDWLCCSDRRRRRRWRRRRRDYWMVESES